MKKYIFTFCAALAMTSCFTACEDDDNKNGSGEPVVVDDESVKEQYYTGGQLGTAFISTSKAYEQPTPAVENSGMFLAFNRGEKMFEEMFTANNNGGEREGLGPLYVRSSCIHCHPGYGHGKTQPDGSFNTRDVGNGYLLVVYNPENDAYVTWLAGMPQSHAIAPFKDPLDETKITIKWVGYTDEWGNKFPDGESYSLVYPEVNLPREAVYVINRGYEDATTTNYEVRLENTIGIYGTGITDAIPDDSITAQWKREEAAYQAGYLKHWNSAWFENGQWKSFYTNARQGDGTKYVRRYTYAMSRGPILDAAGANAIWNITNVTRSDRRYHYLDLNGKIYATCASQDPEVQAGFADYISKISNAEDHPEWFTDNVEANIYNYLTSTNLPIEMSDDDYINFMVWHRGLAVPAARNIDNVTIQQGKKLFEQIGCAQCHRPSWTTGSDQVYDPNNFKAVDPKSANYGKTLTELMPRYPNQKIWPYSDFVQHKLMMKNDIRTGWCRTTPLWGRGLHQICTGAATSDRLHDGRARNVIESIMWHGAAESDARASVEKFRALTKEERDAVVQFIDAI